jgi:hypothetical protein
LLWTENGVVRKHHRLLLSSLKWQSISAG